MSHEIEVDMPRQQDGRFRCTVRIGARSYDVTVSEDDVRALATDATPGELIAESFRDWGRDCYCAPGKDNTCNKRFCWKLGDLPEGYDHKYTYSHIGYNLKATDMQAAVGVAQLDKLPQFIAARQRDI